MYRRRDSRILVEEPIDFLQSPNSTTAATNFRPRPQQGYRILPTFILLNIGRKGRLSHEAAVHIIQGHFELLKTIDG
jgi:hypothetical protein